MITLSVLIISHNQKELLRRCIKSVLQQDLPFEHEIIISDDASTDGTFELAQEYANKYTEISAYSCNSNDCNPTYSSERSGHNRSNAYQHASGKYFCHIDADDFYRPGTDCLKRMVELLESHPECSICMQADCSVDNPDNLEKCWHIIKPEALETGKIISPYLFYKEFHEANNGCMMMRRNTKINPTELYGKWYVDNIITTHHLQFGDIVCFRRDDWIYTHSPSSITKSLSDNDKTIIWSLDYTILRAYWVPQFLHLYYLNRDNLNSLLDALRLIIRQSISYTTKRYCQQFDFIFVFHVAGKACLSKFDKFHLLLIIRYVKFLQKRKNITLWQLQLLNTLCVKTLLI